MPIDQRIKSTAPFLATLLIVLFLVTVFPSLVLFLPRLLYGMPIG